MTDAPEQLAARLDQPDGIAIEDLHAALDAMDGPARLTFIRGLGKRRQVHLWDMADKHMEATLTQLLPAEVEAGRTAVFEGRNSMAMFNLFQKRFTRPAESGDELWGYNHQMWAWFTGPGYFVAREDKDRGVLVFDYTKLPGQAPEGWPALKANEGFPTGMVYGGMVDDVRAVSRDVLIGIALIKGEPRGQYFTLVRSEVI